MRGRHRSLSGGDFADPRHQRQSSWTPLPKALEAHAITSMCTVFAESEVISLRSAGVAPEANSGRGDQRMARRSANFIGRLSAPEPLLLFTGSVEATAPPPMLEDMSVCQSPPIPTPSSPGRSARR